MGQSPHLDTATAAIVHCALSVVHCMSSIVHCQLSEVVVVVVVVVEGNGSNKDTSERHFVHQ